MNIKELRQKTTSELANLLKDKKKELETFVSNIYKSKEKNFKKTSFLRREIARLMTLLREKQILSEEK